MKKKGEKEKDLLAEIEALISKKLQETPEEIKKPKATAKASASPKEKGKISESATKKLIEEIISSTPDLLLIHELVAKKGADPNKTHEDKGDANALHFACAVDNAKILKILIDGGADVNFKNKFGTTALLTAVGNESVECVRLLIENGADVNAVNKQGFAPIHLASEGDEIEIVRMLLDNGADVNLKDGKEDGTPLHRLMTSDSQANVEIAKLLIEYGADVGLQNSHGNAPLHWASGNNRLTLVKLLISNGADVNPRNNEGATPMLWALMKDCHKVIKFLAFNGGTP